MLQFAVATEGTTSLFQVAKEIKTPLALSGLVVIVLYLIFRQLVLQQKGPKFISPQIAKYVFWLALVSMFLGFGGFLIDATARHEHPAPLYGKVHKANDETEGIPGAEVSLDVNYTRHTLTTADGDFVLDILPSELQKHARIWAKAKGFQKSVTKEIIIATPSDRIFIPLIIETNEPSTVPPKPERKHYKTSSWQQHSSNDDLKDVEHCGPPHPGWRIIPETVQFVVEWSQGSVNDEWSFSQEKVSPVVCYKVTTIH